MGNSTVGGIAGVFSSANHSITDCYTAGSFTGSTKAQCEIGGIAGSHDGKIENCYSTANVTTKGSAAGGITGINEGSINHCHSTGTVSGALKIGGIAGTCWNDSKITGCIAFNEQYRRHAFRSHLRRVSGIFSSTMVKSTIEDCYAFDGMKVYKGSVLQPIDDGAVDNINVPTSMPPPVSPPPPIPLSPLQAQAGVPTIGCSTIISQCSLSVAPGVRHMDVGEPYRLSSRRSDPPRAGAIAARTGNKDTAAQCMSPGTDSPSTAFVPAPCRFHRFRDGPFIRE